MFNQTQLDVMLRMQDALNSKINPNWKNENVADFMLAATLEVGEAIEHYGWKWWKHQTPDLNQVRMELVDVWHFVLSDLIRTSHQDEQPIDFYLKTTDFVCITSTTLEPVWVLKLFMRDLVHDYFHPSLFKTVCDTFDLTGIQLFKLYVGKNVLNTFRQNNGYKDGTYNKIWSGREDNEHLTEIMGRININDPMIDENVYAALAAAYEIYA